MGVPRLFPWTRNTFKGSIRYFQKGTYTTTVDYLYFDANGLLHSAAQVIFNYGQKKRHLDSNAHLPYDVKVRKVYDLFFDYIIQLCRTVAPQKVVYIAIDGPAPIAKQAQQRQRRFVAAKTRGVADGDSDVAGDSSPATSTKSKPQSFDSSSISPGTMFMHNLTRYINYRIRREMSSSSSPFSKLKKVHFSPPTVPGEGEHKIMDFMRALPDKERKSSSHCLFGPDGDLIILSLTAHVEDMILFREDQFNPGWLHIVEISKVRRELPKIMSIQRSSDDTIDDFTFLGFFVGNDFLPKAQMFLLLEDGMAAMLRVYAQTSKGKNFIVRDGKVQLKGLRAFVKRIATMERNHLVGQVTTSNPKKQPPDERFINTALTAAVQLSTTGEGYTGGKHKERYTFNEKEYRRAYYKTTTVTGKPGTPEFDRTLKTMCHDYLRTMIWTFEYYVYGLPNWKWAYKHHFPPLMTDLDSYLQSLTLQKFKAITSFPDKGQPSLPFEQLLSILPPTSAGLLPKLFSQLMTDPQSPLVKAGYYPKDFTIFYEGKLKEYQGIALLPFVDPELVRKVYSDTVTDCKDRTTTGSEDERPQARGSEDDRPQARGEGDLRCEYKRNKKRAVDSVNTFVIDRSYTTNFKSSVGNLRGIHVRRTD